MLSLQAAQKNAHIFLSYVGRTIWLTREDRGKVQYTARMYLEIRAFLRNLKV
jgi:hypothetical protein